MPPVRTTAIKPTATTRTHAENQERAYIAASRRSDRSLEARVESARRASEIHKQRTGRSLRVREEDVLNEEMYEEEDDDMHWQYRRMGLLGNFPVNPDLQRRFEAFTSFNVERANLLARAVATTNQNSPHSPHVAGQQQFMNPGMMQHDFQNANMQPGNFNRVNSYRQSPYPVQGSQQQQTMRPAIHQRSASIATPQEPSTYPQLKQSGSSGSSNSDLRRGSLPPRRKTPQSAHPRVESQQEQSLSVPSPAMSRKTSSVHTPNSQVSQSPQQMMSTPQIPPAYQQRHSYAGPFNASSDLNQEDDSPYGPLTTQLPVETQQILADGMFPGYGDQDTTWASNFQQPFYSYNPNSKPKIGKGLQATSGGLNQTLMPTSLDTTFGGNGSFYDSPLSDNADFLDSATSNPGFGFGFDNNYFGFDLFNGTGSSGQRTPADNEFMNQYVDGNMFAA